MTWSCASPSNPHPDRRGLRRRCGAAPARTAPRGPRSHLQRVETIAGVKEALQEGPWDIVLSDYNLPQQSFPEIMHAVRAVDADVPVIVVSGSIGEENAVALMREGVADFVFKGNLSRLIPAIERELAAAGAQDRAARERPALPRHRRGLRRLDLGDRRGAPLHLLLQPLRRGRMGRSAPASARHRGSLPAPTSRRTSTGRRTSPTAKRAKPFRNFLFSFSSRHRLAAPRVDERRAGLRPRRRLPRLPRDGDRPDARR